jgi:hypothetical protein
MNNEIGNRSRSGKPLDGGGEQTLSPLAIFVVLQSSRWLAWAGIFC